MKDNCFFALALSLVPKIGPRKIYQLSQEFSKLEEIFSLDQFSLQKLGFDLISIQEIQSKKTLIKAEQEIALCRQNQINIVYYQDSVYPDLLKSIYDFPPLLFFQGQLESLQSQEYISVVGSRSMTQYGKRVIQKMIPIWVNAGFGICSGYARGVDIQSHLTCVQSGGRTIAVQACGLGYKYPQQHKKYNSQILDRGGFLTEMPFHTKPAPYLFPRRNRIISGLSQAIVVIEARQKSGALITARLGLEQNRDIFAVPQSILDEKSQGTNYLIQQGAHVLIKPDDLLSFYGVDFMQPELVLKELDPIKSDILRFCSEKSLSIDELSISLNQPSLIINQHLTELELDNRIELLAGGRYLAV